jgi:hypothetical protein
MLKLHMGSIQNNINALLSPIFFHLPGIFRQPAAFPSRSQNNNTTQRNISRTSAGHSANGKSASGRGTTRAGRGAVTLAAATPLAPFPQNHSGRQVTTTRRNPPLRVAARISGRGAARQAGPQTAAVTSAVNLRLARMLTEGRKYSGAIPKTVVELMSPVSTGKK